MSYDEFNQTRGVITLIEKQLEKDKKFLEDRIRLSKYKGYNDYFTYIFSCSSFSNEPKTLRSQLFSKLFKIKDRETTLLGDNIKAIENSATLARESKHIAKIKTAFIYRCFLIIGPLIFIEFILYVMIFTYDNSLLNPTSKNISLSGFDLILIGLSAPLVLNLVCNTMLLIKNYGIHFRELKKIENAYQPYANGSELALFKSNEIKKESLLQGFLREMENKMNLTVPNDIKDTIKNFYP